MIGRIFGVILGLIVVAIAGIGLWGYEPDIPASELEATYMNEASRYITLRNGLNVHVRDEGLEDGRVIVLVHGSSASLHTWEPWVARLKDRYRLISMDLAGHGLTGPHPTHDYSMRGQSLLVEEVLEQMGVNQYAIVGSSMGGFISWLHTLENSEKVTGLVLIGASGYAHPERKPSGAYALMQMPVVKDFLQFITPKSIVADTVHMVYAGNPVADDALVTRYHEMLLRAGNREATAIRNAQVRDYAPNQRLGDIKAPTLILHGRLDPLVPVEDGYHFDEDIPNSTLIVYENVGHIPMEEIPDQTVADLVDFLNGPAALDKGFMDKAMDAMGYAAHKVKEAAEDAYDAVAGEDEEPAEAAK